MVCCSSPILRILILTPYVAVHHPEIDSLVTDFHRLEIKHQTQVGELDMYVGTIEKWTLSAVRLQLKHNDESTLYDDLFHNMLLDRRKRGFRDDDLFYHPTVRRILDVES